MHHGVSRRAGRAGWVVAETRPGRAGRSLDWASRLGSTRCSVSWAAQAASKSNIGHAAPSEACVIMEARLVLLYLYYHYNRAGPITRQVTRQVTRDPLSGRSAVTGRSRDATSQEAWIERPRERGSRGTKRAAGALPSRVQGTFSAAEPRERRLVRVRAASPRTLWAAERPTARQQLGPDARVTRHGFGSAMRLGGQPVRTGSTTRSEARAAAAMRRRPGQATRIGDPNRRQDRRLGCATQIGDSDVRRG